MARWSQKVRVGGRTLGTTTTDVVVVMRGVGWRVGLTGHGIGEGVGTNRTSTRWRAIHKPYFRLISTLHLLWPLWGSHAKNVGQTLTSKNKKKNLIIETGLYFFILWLPLLCKITLQSIVKTNSSAQILIKDFKTTLVLLFIYRTSELKYLNLVIVNL